MKMMDHLKIAHDHKEEIDTSFQTLREVNKTIAKDMDILKIPDFKRTKKDRQFLETDFSDHINNINLNVNSSKHTEVTINDF